MHNKMRACRYCKTYEHSTRSCPTMVKTESTTLVEKKEEESLISEKELTKVHIEKEVVDKFREIIEMSKEVAKELGKRSVEGHYQKALGFELQERGIIHSMEETIPVFYKKKYFLTTCRLDIILHNWLPIIIETKAVTTNICPSHVWQLQGYMERKYIQYGVVINFNKSYSKSGIQFQFVVKNDERYFTYDIETGMGEHMQDY